MYRETSRSSPRAERADVAAARECRGGLETGRSPWVKNPPEEHDHDTDDRVTGDRNPARRRVAAAADQPRRRVHARAADRRAAADRPDRHRFRAQRGAAGARPPRTEGVGAGARPGEALRRARPARRRRRGSVRRRRTGQGVVDDRQRTDVAGGLLRRHVRRACEPARSSALAVRDRGSEATLPAPASHRRNRRRVLPERAGLRLRRPRRQDARRPPGGRQLRAQRREDAGSPTAASPISTSCSPK